MLYALGAASALIAEPAFAAFAKRNAPCATMRVPMVIGLMMAAPLLVVALLRFGR